MGIQELSQAETLIPSGGAVLTASDARAVESLVANGFTFEEAVQVVCFLFNGGGGGL